ncbi:MAG: hypothetical protein ACOC0W_02250 [Desulfosalsimonas sp.]
MTKDQKSSEENRIAKLIRFFRQMPGRKPAISETDYSGWHQSEDQYQRQQAKWLRQVEERKKNKKPPDEKNRK